MKVNDRSGRGRSERLQAASRDDLPQPTDLHAGWTRQERRDLLLITLGRTLRRRRPPVVR
jgi:hypothetical protein